MGTAISCYRTLYCYLEKREIRDRGKFGAEIIINILHCIYVRWYYVYVHFFLLDSREWRGCKIMKIMFNVPTSSWERMLIVEKKKNSLYLPRFSLTYLWWTYLEVTCGYLQHTVLIYRLSEEHVTFFLNKISSTCHRM